MSQPTPFPSLEVPKTELARPVAVNKADGPMSPTTPGGSTRKMTELLTKPFSALRKRVNKTKTGTLLLARHVQDILRDELYIDVKYKEAPPAVSRELRSLENLAEYHRWLRGFLALFGFAVYVLALVVIETRDRRVSWFLLILSLMAEYCIVRIYVVKAQYVGLTNPVYGKNASIINSPFCYQMIGEMVLWLIQTPPSLEDNHPFRLLNFIVFLRNYSLIMYLNNATFVYRTFCRAMSAMCGLPLSNSFFVRTSLIYNKMKACTIMVTWCWLTLALLFSKSENRAYADSMWFIFVTVGTIGYGDISPVTVIGRLTAFLAWVFALVLIGYVVVLTHDTLALRDHERNLYILFRSSEMAGKMKIESAKVIQAWWRFTLVKKQQRAAPWRNFYAWVLMQQVAKLREQRETLRETAKRFHEITLDEKFSDAMRSLKARNRESRIQSPTTSFRGEAFPTYYAPGGSAAPGSGVEKKAKAAAEPSTLRLAVDGRRASADMSSRRASHVVHVAPPSSYAAHPTPSSSTTAAHFNTNNKNLPSTASSTGAGSSTGVSEQRLQRLEQRTAKLASLLRSLADE